MPHQFLSKIELNLAYQGLYAWPYQLPSTCTIIKTIHGLWQFL